VGLTHSYCPGLGQQFRQPILDGDHLRGRMGAAGCATADLDGDRRIDVACVSNATATLKWYRNLAPARAR